MTMRGKSHPQMINNISILIISLNEERVIARALDSVLKFASEIVVVDSGSSDTTVDIASAYPQAKVFHRKFDDFASQRNFGLSMVTGAWVFVLDADEVVNGELADYLSSRALIPGNFYKVDRLNWMWGAPLRYAAAPDYQSRLFQNLPENRYVGEVHESLHTQASVSAIRGMLIHMPDISATRLFDKQNKYTSLEVSKGRESQKTIAWLVVRPAIRFFWVLFIKRGILDGRRGIAWALVTAAYDCMTAVKVLEARFQKGDGK